MKKVLQSIVLLLGVLMLPTVAYAQNNYGDVNGDLEVNIADVNAVIDVILNDATILTADVNQDGEINIADINVIISVILGDQPKTLYSTILVTTSDGVTVEHLIDQNSHVSIEKPNLIIETDGKVLTYDLEQMARLCYGHRYVTAGQTPGSSVPQQEDGVMPDGDNRPQYALFTYRNDGDFNAFLNIDVDSITYSNTDLNGVAHGNAVVQQVWTPDSLYRIPLAVIDSVCFKAPPTEYKPNVVIIDERHMPYIIDASDSTITFNSSVPTDMVPTMGQIMYSDLTDDPFYMGFAGRVIGIERKNSQVTYFCDPVAPNEVYERCVNFFKVVTDTTEVIDENVPANSPRRIGTFIATDGTISMPELKWNLDFNLNKLTGCHGNVKIEGKINNDFEYVICIGMLDHDFINVKHTKKITHSTNVSFKIENEAECDTSIFMSTPVYTTGCQWFGVSLYPGLFFDAKIAAELEAKLPYSSTQVEEYYFGSDRGWTDPLITSNESGGWPGFSEFLQNGNVKFKFKGTLAFGPTVKAAFVVWKPKTFNFGVTAKAGLELSGECSCDLTELVDDAQFDWYDDVWSNTKITTGLKLGFNISGKIMKKECNIWGASTTLFKQEKYLFPKFTMPTLPQYQNGTWQPSAAPTSMYTVPSQELLLPGKVGLGVYNQDGTPVRDYYYDGWYFGTEDYWPQNAVQCSLAGLEAGHEYVVRPLYKMLNLFEVKGGPRTVFCSPEPMSLETPTLQLIKATRSDVNILGGWGYYTASSSNSNVATATIVSTYASGVETFLVRVEAVKPGETTIKVKDVRTGDIVSLPVTVIDGQNKPLYVAEEALDFGDVPVGTSSTKTISLINNTTSAKKVTATVNATFDSFAFSEGQSCVSNLTIDVPAMGCSYVSILFMETLPGDYSGTVKFQSDAFEDGECYVLLHGRAVIEGQGLPVISVSPSRMDFRVPVGQSMTKHLTVSNVGDGILRFLVSETQGPQLTIPESGQEFSLNAGESKVFDVICTPSGSGYSFGPIVRIYSNAENGTQGVAINATGVESEQHEYVDLGLLSGTLWATCNIGASAPEEYGDYFAWGETDPKDYYDWNTYKWCNGSDDTMSKYSTNIYNGYNGFTDGKTELDPEDDAAYVNWGSSWRIPTKAQQDELRDNCTWTWTTCNGVEGSLVTGPNGNSIFLPAAGCRWDEFPFDAVSCGDYWSRTLHSVYSDSAYGLSSDSTGVYLCFGSRNHGFTVRPVRVSEN